MRILEYKENKAHGSFDFPVEAYYIDRQHPRYIMPAHWHEEHEIIKVVNGKFHYEIGSEKGTALPGELLYINSGVLHAGIPEECEYCCAVFEIGFLSKNNTACGKVLSPLENGDVMISLHLPVDDKQVDSTVSRLFDILLGGAGGNELQVQGLLLLLLGDLTQSQNIDERAEDILTKKNSMKLKRALSVIENDYSMPITLETLACEAGMSPKYFCSFFKQMTHYSPIEYLIRHRIEVACYRLMSGSQNITDLAYACGFNDLSYFIRTFKKVVGVTPKQYLRACSQSRKPCKYPRRNEYYESLAADRRSGNTSNSRSRTT